MAQRSIIPTIHEISSMFLECSPPLCEHHKWSHHPTAYYAKRQCKSGGVSPLHAALFGDVIELPCRTMDNCDDCWRHPHLASFISKRLLIFKLSDAFTSVCVCTCRRDASKLVDIKPKEFGRTEWTTDGTRLTMHQIMKRMHWCIMTLAGRRGVCSSLTPATHARRIKKVIGWKFGNWLREEPFAGWTNQLVSVDGKWASSVEMCMTISGIRLYTRRLEDGILYREIYSLLHSDYPIIVKQLSG